jgi:hypothetical protein
MAGQCGKPTEPIIFNELMNLFFPVKLMQMTEKVNRNDFLVGKNRLEIARALIFNTCLFIVRNSR